MSRVQLDFICVISQGFELRSTTFPGHYLPNRLSFLSLSYVPFFIGPKVPIFFIVFSVL